MIIYNLTDRTPPWEKTPRTPNKVKIRGVSLSPGESHEFSNFPLAQVSGLITGHKISVDGIPDWYQKGVFTERDKRFESHFAQVAEKAKETEKVEAAPKASDDDETTEIKTSKKKRSKK